MRTNQTITSKAVVLAGFLFLSLFTASNSFAYDYQATAIQPPAGYTASRAMGINNLGEVVGRFYNLNPANGEAINRQAFVWDTANGAALLQTLSGESSGWDINDNGFVTGYSYNAAGKQRAVLWDLEEGSIDDIGGLRNPTTLVYGESSTGYGINNLDQVVGSADIPNDANTFTPFHAFLDDGNGLLDLGTFANQPEWQDGYSIAYDINNNGEIVGIAHDDSWAFLPFIYDEATGMQALQRASAYPTGEWYAVAINDSGLIGGHVIAATNKSFPYYWPNKSSVPVKITMPANFPYGEIYGINASGQMVGIMWSSDQAGATEHAFIFDTQHGVRDLNNLIDPASGWVLNFARDINDKGQVAGYGELSSNKRGFMLSSIPTRVSASVSLPSPKPEGTLVTLTAQALGGLGPYEYKFWIKKAIGSWVAVQGYSSLSTYTWNTTGFGGINQIQIWARNVGSTAAYEAYSSVVSYVVGSGTVVPPSAVSLSVNASSPQLEGTVITLSAQALGGSGPYEYKFWIRKASGEWVAVQGYSSLSTYTWNTTGFGGINQIQIWARNSGSGAAYEAFSNVVSYVVGTGTAVPPSAVSVSVSASSPRPEGTVITLSAQALGGSGPYEYKFWIRKAGGEWVALQGYWSFSIYTWNTTGFTGTNQIQIWVRNIGSNAAYEAYSNVVSYVVGNGSAVPPTAVSVSVSALSPQPEGSVVTLSAQASGGSGPYEYMFWIRKEGGSWVAVRGYSSSASYSWDTTGFGGTNQIQIWARNMGSSASYEAYSNVVSYMVGN